MFTFQGPAGPTGSEGAPGKDGAKVCYEFLILWYLRLCLLALPTLQSNNTKYYQQIPA